MKNESYFYREIWATFPTMLLSGMQQPIGLEPRRRMSALERYRSSELCRDRRDTEHYYGEWWGKSYPALAIQNDSTYTMFCKLSFMLIRDDYAAPSIYEKEAIATYDQEMRDEYGDPRNNAESIKDTTVYVIDDKREGVWVRNHIPRSKHTDRKASIKFAEQMRLFCGSDTGTIRVIKVHTVETVEVEL